MRSALFTSIVSIIMALAVPFVHAEEGPHPWQAIGLDYSDITTVFKRSTCVTRPRAQELPSILNCVALLQKAFRTAHPEHSEGVIVFTHDPKKFDIPGIERRVVAWVTNQAIEFSESPEEVPGPLNSEILGYFVDVSWPMKESLSVQRERVRSFKRIFSSEWTQTLNADSSPETLLKLSDELWVTWMHLKNGLERKLPLEKTSQTTALLINAYLQETDPHARIVPWSEIYGREYELRQKGGPIRLTLMRSETGLTVNHVQVSYFSERDRFCEDIEEIKSQLVASADGLKHVLIDLRANPGGEVNSADCLLQAFQQSQKPTISILAGLLDPSRHETKTLGTDKEQPELRTTVLVDSWSASAAELVAGALQFADQSLVVGQQTFGKGVTQVIESFPPITIQGMPTVSSDEFGSLDAFTSPQLSHLLNESSMAASDGFPFWSVRRPEIAYYHTSGTFYFIVDHYSAKTPSGRNRRLNSLWTNHIQGLTPDIPLHEDSGSVPGHLREIDQYVKSSVGIDALRPAPYNATRGAKARWVKACLKDRGEPQSQAQDPMLDQAVAVVGCTSSYEKTLL